MLTQTGAHTRQQGMNHRSVGICIIGDFDLAPPNQEQWTLALRLTRSLMSILKIPAERIYGHREFASYKTCPGALFDLEKFRLTLKDMRVPL